MSKEHLFGYALVCVSVVGLFGGLYVNSSGNALGLVAVALAAVAVYVAARFLREPPAAIVAEPEPEPAAPAPPEDS